MEKKLLLMKSVLQTCFFGIKEQRNMAAVIGAISLLSLFMFLFYNPFNFIYSPGINLVIMTIMALATAISLYQPALNNKIFWWATFGSIFSAFNVFYQPDMWSFLIFFSSFFLAVGSLQRKFNNIIVAAIQWVIIQFSSPFYTLHFLVDPKNWKGNSRQMMGKIIKLAFIPVAILGVFIGLYGAASEPFYNMVAGPIIDILKIQSFNIESFFVLIIGTIFIIPLMIPVLIKSIQLSPVKEAKTIKRNREKVQGMFNMLDLSNELKIGTFTLIGLNILVFLFNTLDLIHVWFGSAEMTVNQLSQYVHEGTNMVILSITIGAGILIILFRRNLNFHPKNKNLKTLAYIWLGQNAFLALSTFTRNLHYVNQYGLTYKRLGVVIFIVGVLVGLFFIYQKISKKHSITNFINRLLLAFYIILIGFSVIDHQRLIIQHAVFLQKENVDLYYLTSISSEHDYLLFKHMETLNAKSHQNLNITESYRYSENSRGNKNWRSFNYMSYKNSKLMNNLAVSATSKSNTIGAKKQKPISSGKHKLLVPEVPIVIKGSKTESVSDKIAFENEMVEKYLKAEQEQEKLMEEKPVYVDELPNEVSKSPLTPEK